MIKNSTKLNTFDYLRQIGVITDEDIVMAEKWADEISINRFQKSTEDVLDSVCDYFLINRTLLESRSRMEPYATARMIYYYLAYQEGHTCASIGKGVYKKSSTVVQGKNKIAELIDKSKSYYNEKLDAIVLFIRNQMYINN